MESQYTHIIAALPYSHPFLFVDELMEVSDSGVVGTYTYDAALPFYQGHFVGAPVTPGVILTETMAQIGVVCLAISLMGNDKDYQIDLQIAMTSSAVDFYLPVLPGATVTVKSVKEYLRFGKLKCKVEMYNEANELVCRGTISGMMKMKPHE